MLTIKIIDQDGIQLVKEVKSVILRPGKETEDGRNCLTYFETDLYHKDVFWGDVYVMNDNGKTVANYCLGHPKVKNNIIDVDNVGYCKV